MFRGFVHNQNQIALAVDEMFSHEHVVAVGEELRPQHLPVDDLAVHPVDFITVDDVEHHGRVIPLAAVINISLDEHEILGGNVGIADVDWKGMDGSVGSWGLEWK